MKDLYYEITENGYHIYDRNDEMFHIYQYEPYIPDKTKSYQENAEEQIHSLIVSEYVEKVVAGTMTIDDVPAELKEQVQKIIDSIPKNPYGISDELCETIKQDTVNEIVEGVSGNDLLL